MLLRFCLLASAGLQATGHSDEPLPDEWYEIYRTSRQLEMRDRRLGADKPLPAKPPSGGDPEEVHIFVIGDWGTYPGTGINMRSQWNSRQWNSWCFVGGRSQKEWEEAKRSNSNSAAKVMSSWNKIPGPGSPFCGSMHIECSWGKTSGGRCNPDNAAYWRDHYAQQNVSTAMTDKARSRKASFVINTADNFYMGGVESTEDDYWSMMFEELYTDESLQIPWLSSLGNHDYGGHDCDFCLWPTARGDPGHNIRRGKPCSQAMIDYDTEHDWQWPNPKTVRWVMPMKGNDRWYMKSFKFPKANVTIDVFVIDTNKAHIESQCKSHCPEQMKAKCTSFFHDLWTRQKDWLLPALEKSKADWKMVVGHAPPENFEAEMMENMRDRGVSVYMAGHVHQLRHDRHPSGIEAIISGSGGGYQSAGGGTSYTLHESQDYGFATMHVEYHQISVEYFNDEGRRLWDPVVIPRIDVVQESLLKKLREAAIAGRTMDMKELIGKAKDHGVDESFINSAALAGVKAFEAGGGMAFLHMKPEIMKADESTFSGFLSTWTTEERLPTAWTTLFYRQDTGACCSKLQLPPPPTKTTVLCYPAPAICTPQQMAGKLSESGAAAMLLAMQKDDLKVVQVDENSDLTAEEESMPVMSVPQSAIKDVGSWLGNPDEKIGILLFGGKGAWQAAVNGAREAGVSEHVIEAAVQEAKRLRAEEKLQEIMVGEDIGKIREALDVAKQLEAQSDIIEQASRLLTELELQGDLSKIADNCNDIEHVHQMIQQAEVLEVVGTDAALQCRADLALKALQAAVGLGSNCKTPLAAAVEWCEISNITSDAIAKAQEDCAHEVAAASKRDLIIAVAAVAAIAVGAGLCFVVSRKRPQAPARESPGGIELLDNNAS